MVLLFNRVSLLIEFLLGQDGFFLSLLVTAFACGTSFSDESYDATDL